MEIKKKKRVKKMRIESMARFDETIFEPVSVGECIGCQGSIYPGEEFKEFDGELIHDSFECFNEANISDCCGAEVVSKAWEHDPDGSGFIQHCSIPVCSICEEEQ